VGSGLLLLSLNPAWGCQVLDGTMWSGSHGPHVWKTPTCHTSGLALSRTRPLQGHRAGQRSWAGQLPAAEPMESSVGFSWSLLPESVLQPLLQDTLGAPWGHCPCTLKLCSADCWPVTAHGNPFLGISEVSRGSTRCCSRGVSRRPSTLEFGSMGAALVCGTGVERPRAGPGRHMVST
jgi:hypothetical protein